MPIATVVIPSVYHAQLEWFLKHNSEFIRDLRVIIVTSSAESTQSFLEQYVPDVTVIFLPKPIGFARTVNLGLKAATTDWIATCNDDVLLSDNWLELLVAPAQDKTGGINPVIMNTAKEVETAGITILPIGRAQPLIEDIPETPFFTEALNAACVVYRRQALMEVGYFDERFGSYLEDVDVSLSLMKAGWSQLVVPSVRVTHYQHQTSTKLLGWKKTAFDARNWWILLAKHWSWRSRFRYLPGILLERAKNVSGIVKALLQSGK